MPLITPAEAKEQIPSLTGSTEDTLLTPLIAGVGAAFARYCGYPPASSGAVPTMEDATYTGYAGAPDGLVRVDDGRHLCLGVWPVVSVTSIHDDSEEGYGADTLIDGAEYALRGAYRELVRLTPQSSHAWSANPYAVKVVFVAGFATVDDDLKRLAMMGARHAYDLRQTQGQASTSKNGISISFRPEDFLPAPVRQGLAGFRLPRCFL